MVLFVCRKSVSKSRSSALIMEGWSIGMVWYAIMWICIHHFISCHSFTFRFILEPKSVLMNEQEQKLNDCESAIATMQVHFILFLSFCIWTWKKKRKPWSPFFTVWLGFQRLPWQTAGRSREQHNRAASSGPWACAPDSLDDCSMRLVCSWVT